MSDTWVLADSGSFFGPAWVCDCGEYVGTEPPVSPPWLPADALEVDYYIGLPNPDADATHYNDGSYTNDHAYDVYRYRSGGDVLTDGSGAGPLDSGSHLILAWYPVDTETVPTPSVLPLDLALSGYVADGRLVDLPPVASDWGGIEIEASFGSVSHELDVTSDWGGFEIQAQAVVYDHGDPPPTFAPAAIALYDANNHWLANFPNAIGVAFRDALLAAGPGYVSCAIPLDDPNYSLIGPNTVFKAIWKGRARVSAPVKLSSISVNVASEGRIFRTFNEMPDLLTVALGSIPIYPEWELERAQSQTRILGYPSRVRSRAGNWTRPVAVRWSEETGVKANKPKGLGPSLNPKWTSKYGSHVNKPSSYAEWHYRAFTTYQEMTFNIAGTADNEITLYLDGESVFTPDNQQGQTWHYLGVVTVTIPAGKHVLAAKVGNVRISGGHVYDYSPVALLLALQQLDSKGNPVKGPPFLISDERWLVSDVYPGFHGGEIFAMLWGEGAANGFAWAQRLHLGFTIYRDSAGHLHADTPQERAFDNGSPLLSAAQALSEDAFDMCLDAQTHTVQEFNRLGSDKSASVGFKFGSNDDLDEPNPVLRGSIIDYDVDLTEPTTNSVLVQLADGSYQERNHSGSVATYGKEGAGLSLGSTTEDNTVAKVAAAQFNETARRSFTYKLRVTTLAGPQPYEQVNKGDSVFVPDETLIGTDKARITAFVYDGSTDDAGEPTITVELAADPT